MADKKASLTLVLNSRVTSVLSGIKRVGSAVGELAMQVGKPLMWGGTIAFGAISAGSAVASKSILQFGSVAEQTRLRFQTMLGSIEKGDAMMSKLDRFSNSTPYSGEEVNKAAGTLLAFGIAAGDVEGTLRKVGDVAAGSGKNFNELSAIYGKVFAKGKMDTEAMNQMVEAGIPIVKTLGEMYGKSGEEIYKMAESGTISADMVSRAYDKMSGAGGVYSDMMAKQSDTVKGLWDAVIGQLEYAAANFGESLLPLIKEGLTVLQGWADQVVVMSKDGRLVEYFSTAASVAIDVGTMAAKGLNLSWQIAKFVYTQIGNIAKGTWLGVQSGAMLAFVNTCEGLNTAGNYIYAGLQTIGRFFRMIFNGVSSTVASVFAGVINTVISAVNIVIKALNKIPGVDIGLVEKPAFVRQIEEFARKAGDKAYSDWQNISSGQDFKDAKVKAEHQNRAEFGSMRKSAEGKGDEAYRLLSEAGKGFNTAVENFKSGNEAIEEFSKTAKSKISSWADTAQANLNRRNAAEKGVKFDPAIQNKQSATVGGSAAALPRISADSFTKIGLYNFGKYSTRSLDKERNRLLQNIADTLQQSNAEPGVQLI